MTGTARPASPSLTTDTNSTDTGAKDAVTAKVSEVASDAMEQVSDVSGKVRTRAIDMANERRASLVEPARNITVEGERIARELKDRGQDRPAELLETATHRVDTLVSWVEETPVEQMLDDITMRAKKRPLTFIGAAAALGFVGARMVKASGAAPTAPVAGGGASSDPEYSTWSTQAGGYRP